MQTTAIVPLRGRPQNRTKRRGAFKRDAQVCMYVRGNVEKPAASELDWLARAARALYVFHRRDRETRLSGVPSLIGGVPIPTWDGGIDRSGRRFTPVWPRVAELVRARQYLLPIYVEAYFEATRAEAPPTPNELLSARAEDCYRKYLARAGEQAAAELRSEKVAFTLDVLRASRLYGLSEKSAAPRQVLQDRTLPYTPLFRHCMAAEGRAFDVSARFQEAALNQLVLGLFRYTAGWTGFLPAGLSREAEGVLRTLLAGQESDT